MNWTKDTPSLNESNANETNCCRSWNRFIGVGANVTLSRDSTRIPDIIFNYLVMIPNAFTDEVYRQSGKKLCPLILLER